MGHEVDAAGAETLRAATAYPTPGNANPSFTTIKGVFTAANLNKMGVSCADVGGFVAVTTPAGKEVTATDFEVCTDGATALWTNTDADTRKCLFTTTMPATPCTIPVAATAATTTPAPSAAIGTRPSMAF